VACEFLLAFPFAFLFFLAVAEFGLLLTNLRHVELAAFESAREVARLDKQHLGEAAPIARRRANRALQTAGTGQSCLVIVEHNVPDAGNEFQVSAVHGLAASVVGPRRPLPGVGRVRAVRCTVAVRMRHLAPDLLAMVGFSLKDRKAYATVTVPWVGDCRPKQESGEESKDEQPQNN
jgi:hypothetical protein